MGPSAYGNGTVGTYPYGPTTPIVAEAEPRPDSADRSEAAMVSPPLLHLIAAPVNLNHPGHYVKWGVIQISVANLVVIGIMIALFVLALVLPFPKGKGRS